VNRHSPAESPNFVASKSCTTVHQFLDQNGNQLPTLVGQDEYFSLQSIKGKPKQTRNKAECK
jgi:hypothetical protein